MASVSLMSPLCPHRKRQAVSGTQRMLSDGCQGKARGFRGLWGKFEGIADGSRTWQGRPKITSYDPIALVAQSSNILVVHPSVPVGYQRLRSTSCTSLIEAVALPSTTLSPAKCR